MKRAGVAIAGFAASRKTLESVFTKLLARRDSLAAEVHDRLRFRIVTRTLDDLFQALLCLTRWVLPFEVASVILLGAILGAVILTKRRLT